MSELARMDDLGDRAVVVNMNPMRRGALSQDLYDAIGAALELAKEPRIRAVLLTSEGGFFCAGGDLNVIIERRGLSEEERRAKVNNLHDLIRGIRDCPVPVIAAVEGGAAGAGVSLALVAPPAPSAAQSAAVALARARAWARFRGGRQRGSARGELPSVRDAHKHVKKGRARERASERERGIFLYFFFV